MFLCVSTMFPVAIMKAFQIKKKPLEEILISCTPTASMPLHQVQLLKNSSNPFLALALGPMLFGWAPCITCITYGRMWYVMNPLTGPTR